MLSLYAEVKIPQIRQKRAAYIKKGEKMTEEKNIRAPWKPYIGDIPFHLEYDEGTIFQAMEKAALEFPDYDALEFMGKKIKYKTMLSEVRKCAKAYKAIGVRKGDRVVVAMPNCPQAVYTFYALSCIGAISVMVHPLSSENELAFFIQETESVTLLTLDQFYNKVEAIRKETKLVNVVIASVKDELSPVIKTGYMLTEGRKIEKIPKDAPVIMWKDFMKRSKNWSWEYQENIGKDDTAVILFSGGTTGRTKGVELTNLNFNAMASQLIATNPMFRPGDHMLAAIPVFHGFGLGVCIHTMLANGGCSLLIPRFTAKSYSKLVAKNTCNFLAGVPTLYEAMLREPSLEKANLSNLKGIYCGGDSLTIDLKKRLDKFFYDHNSPVPVREGYGMAETINATCLTPVSWYKEGSIGQPLPDEYFKICRPDTTEEVPYGEEGEICIHGVTNMKGYLNNPEETAKTMRLHDDGYVWIHTGDLGRMDDQGFIYFRGRIKRMIVSSGYNIYPAEMENILEANKMVHLSCVIGVPDDYRVQRVKAFIVLEPGYPANQDTWLKLMAYCKKNIARYAMPYDIEFRESLPTTVVGKVAYRILEEEEIARIEREKEEAAQQAAETEENS